jgi:hypothetical protein
MKIKHFKDYKALENILNDEYEDENEKKMGSKN